MPLKNQFAVMVEQTKIRNAPVRNTFDIASVKNRELDLLRLKKCYDSLLGRVLDVETEND